MRIIKTMNFTKKNNFDQITNITKHEFSKGEKDYVYFKFSVTSEYINNILYLVEEKNSSLYVIQEVDQKKLLCYTKKIEYQFNLQKYGCYKTEVTEVKFLNYDFVEDSVRLYPSSTVKCLRD